MFQLHTAGAKVLMVNTDGPAWGGSLSDLDDVVVSVYVYIRARE